MNIEVTGLRAGYGLTEVVRGIDLELASGDAMAILGKNGMGKTTLVKGLLGLVRRTGSIRLDGRETGDWATHRMIRAGVAYGPQDGALFGDLTVGENLRLGRVGVGGSGRGPDWLFERFPVLEERLEQPAGTLSGGEQKMLILARALVAEPALLILDEISEGLQPSMVQVVSDLLRAERERRALTVLLVEQNVRLAMSVASRVLVLRRGETAFEASSDDEATQGKVLEELSL